MASSASSAAESTKSAADSFWEVQKRLDILAAKPVVTPTRGGKGFGALYASLADPPIAEKAKLFGQLNTLYGTNASLGNNLSTVVSFTDADAKAMRDKNKVEAQMMFDTWIGSVYDPIKNPAEREWLQKIYPEWYEARLKENEASHEIKKQWIDIGIRGPKSKEDLYLMYKWYTDPNVADRMGTGNMGVAPAAARPGIVAGHFFNRDKAALTFPAGTYYPTSAPEAGTLTGLNAWFGQAFNR